MLLAMIDDIRVRSALAAAVVVSDKMTATILYYMTMVMLMLNSTMDAKSFAKFLW